MPTLRNALLRHFFAHAPQDTSENYRASLSLRRDLLTAILRLRAGSQASNTWNDLRLALEFDHARSQSQAVVAAENDIEFEEAVTIAKMFIGNYRLGYRLIVFCHGTNWSTGSAGELRPEDRNAL